MPRVKRPLGCKFKAGPSGIKRRGLAQARPLHTQNQSCLLHIEQNVVVGRDRPVVGGHDLLHGVHGGAQRIHSGNDLVCIHVGLLLAIEGLGLLMHGVECLDGVVDGGDAVAELVECVLLALHGGLGTGGTNSLKALSDLGGIGGNDRAIGTTRLANHRGGLDVHELVVLLELTVVAALGLGLGQDTRLLKERNGLIGNKGGQGVGRGLVVGKTALLGLNGPLVRVAVTGEQDALVVGILEDGEDVIEEGAVRHGTQTYCR